MLEFKQAEEKSAPGDSIRDPTWSPNVKRWALGEVPLEFRGPAYFAIPKSHKRSQNCQVPLLYLFLLICNLSQPLKRTMKVKSRVSKRSRNLDLRGNERFRSLLRRTFALWLPPAHGNDATCPVGLSVGPFEASIAHQYQGTSTSPLKGS